MLKYHVAVCDDEKSDLDGIVQSVQQYDVQGCFDIETYMDGNELLSELQMQKKSFDLLLLDIEMPSNGFQLAQSLIQMEKHPLVVFVTKRHEYAVQGYGIAFRYLVKPLDQTLFAAAMDAVLQELNSKHFTIEYDGVTMSLETSDIYFLESHGHKVLIHCKEQDLTLRMSIPEALEQLPKRCFVSPHKSYLVNMEHIVYATGTAVFLSSGHQLPISRRKRQEFNQIFNASSLPVHPHPPCAAQCEDRAHRCRCRRRRRNPDCRFHSACPVQQGGRQPEPTRTTLQLRRSRHRTAPGETSGRTCRPDCLPAQRRESSG